MSGSGVNSPVVRPYWNSTPLGLLEVTVKLVLELLGLYGHPRTGDQ